MKKEGKEERSVRVYMRDNDNKRREKREKRKVKEVKGIMCLFL